MGDLEIAAELPAHILIFPIPLLGHVNSMLNLAELLCLSGLHVTILLFDYIHTRLLRHAALHRRFSAHPAFRVATLSDGLPADHPRSGERIMDTIRTLKEVGGPQFRTLMESTDGLSSGDAPRRRVSCLIVDGALSFTIPVVEELGIPYLYFRTISACAFWAYFCTQRIIDSGEIPLKGENEDTSSYWKREDLDLTVTSVPGMESFLRRRDLPVVFRVEDINDSGMLIMKTETEATVRGRGLILNTFEDLEGPMLGQIRKHIPNLYSIGPLHAHLKARLDSSGMESSDHRSSSFWKEDDSCMSWLDSQPVKSVIYVSFGSITLLTRDELMEFWYGLVNSRHRFLWVVRPNSVIGDDDQSKNKNVPVELEEGTRLRGLMLEWVPQQQVLRHSAIGAFFTHSGWNSTLESIAVGLPMLCWPYFADQTTNSRFVSEVWKIGLDMKDTCDRMLVEKMVRDVMEVRRNEFVETANGMAILARKAISEGGSSYLNLNRLIQFLKSTV